MATALGVFAAVSLPVAAGLRLPGGLPHWFFATVTRSTRQRRQCADLELVATGQSGLYRTRDCARTYSDIAALGQHPAAAQRDRIKNRPVGARPLHWKKVRVPSGSNGGGPKNRDPVARLQQAGYNPHRQSWRHYPYRIQVSDRTLPALSSIIARTLSKQQVHRPSRHDQTASSRLLQRSTTFDHQGIPTASWKAQATSAMRLHQFRGHGVADEVFRPLK